jgi:hypothetical protein
MPTDQALQVFYGTLPLILILVGIWLREQMLLKGIVARLRLLEEGIKRISERLIVLETRAGVIYHE